MVTNYIIHIIITSEHLYNDYILLSVFSSSTKAEELRKRVIQESKYLGGDMKHTHLVKGLDYALLQKVHLLAVTTILAVLSTI